MSRFECKDLDKIVCSGFGKHNIFYDRGYIIEQPVSQYRVSVLDIIIAMIAESLVFRFLLSIAKLQQLLLDNHRTNWYPLFINYL